MSDNHIRSRFVCPIRETFYLMFCKKKCPNCGKKLYKEKKWVVNLYTEWKTSNSKTHYSPEGFLMKDIYYEFTCENCEFVRIIGDLSDGVKTAYKAD